MHKGFKLWASLLMLTLVIVAGCGGGAKTPEPAKASAPAPAPTPAKTSLKVTLAPGPKGALTFLTEMVAEGTGAFKEQGIDLTVLPTDGGNTATKALMSGQADFATLAFDHVLKNRAQGSDLVVVGFLSKVPTMVMVVQNDLKNSVKSIKDLKGKKMGVSSIGGGTHMAVLSLMNKAGMSPNDIEFVAAKDKLVQMWDAKEIAAAMHVDPQISQLTSENKAWVLHDFRKTKDTIDFYGTEYPVGTLVTRQEVIDKNPEMVQRFVDAIMAANKFIAANGAKEIAAKVPAEYKGDPKLYEVMVKDNLDGLAITGLVSEDSMKTVLNELREKKVIPADSKVDIKTSVNLSFVQKAKK